MTFLSTLKFPGNVKFKVQCFIYTYKEILKQIKMASPHAFSVPGLEKKLKELNTTLQSIQSLSQWAIHHRKHAKTVVSVWYKDLQKGVCHLC